MTHSFPTRRSSNLRRPKYRHLLSLADRIRGHKSRDAFGLHSEVGGLHKPAGNIIERLPTFHSSFKDSTKVFFLLFRLPLGTQIRWVPADVGFSTLVQIGRAHV